MKRALCLFAAVLLVSTAALAASNERWLHVRVEETGPNAENVRVNVPLSLAEKVLPSLQAEHIRHGRLTLEDIDTHGIDLRTLLAAVRETHERDGKQELETVDVQVPMAVVDAMLTDSPNELDLAAGVRALAALGDTVLVTVKERNSSVRIWVDSKSTSD